MLRTTSELPPNYTNWLIEPETYDYNQFGHSQEVSFGGNFFFLYIAFLHLLRLDDWQTVTYTSPNMLKIVYSITNIQIPVKYYLKYLRRQNYKDNEK